MTRRGAAPARPGAPLRLVGHPERFLNPLLLVLLICQLVQATLVGIVSERLFRHPRHVIATIFNVVIVFALAEAAPRRGRWSTQSGPHRSSHDRSRPCGVRCRSG
jgi:hypothetical protein